LKTSCDELSIKLKKVLNHEVLVSSPEENSMIHSVGIITGGANSEWKLALKEGLSAYITGEMSEHDWHEARESNVVMMAGGHHATEQFGIQALMKKIEEDLKINCFYIDSKNPA
jgi:putative NIF3 family GTP cyclohydrolase 1 type 2